MDYIDNIPALRSAIAGFQAAHSDNLAPVTSAALIGAAGQASCVEQFTRTVEALYAGLEAISDPATLEAAATLTGQLTALIVTLWQMLSMGEEPDRGERILAAMRRRLGETEGPDPSEDPLPLAEYVPPSE